MCMEESSSAILGRLVFVDILDEQFFGIVGKLIFVDMIGGKIFRDSRQTGICRHGRWTVP